MIHKVQKQYRTGERQRGSSAALGKTLDKKFQKDGIRKMNLPG